MKFYNPYIKVAAFSIEDKQEILAARFFTLLRGLLVAGTTAARLLFHSPNRLLLLR